MTIKITIDSDNHDLNIAIATLIQTKLIGLKIDTKVESDIKQQVNSNTVFMAVTKIENELKTSDVNVVIGEGNISKSLQEFGPLA